MRVSLCISLLTLAASMLASCASLRQDPGEVLSREPGERLLGHAAPVETEAREQWEYAWLSLAAYGRAVPEDEREKAAQDVEESGCLTPDVTLQDAGWRKWADFPDESMRLAFKKTHLRIEVWEKIEPQRHIIAAAFGGTIFTNGQDWVSNLRWFLPAHDDEYTHLVKDFAPRFSKEIAKIRAATPQNMNITVVSTGHSLGGGLAQQLAYAMPVSDEQIRVSTVYAFDPSPVTGFYSVGETIRDENRKHLNITRIYERGEVLAIIRSFFSFLYPPSESDPAIRAVRYSFFYSPKPIASHSMPKLACALHKAARGDTATESMGMSAR